MTYTTSAMRWDIVLFNQLSSNSDTIDIRELIMAYETVMESQNLPTLNGFDISSMLGKSSEEYEISYIEYFESLIKFIELRDHYLFPSMTLPARSKKWRFDKERDEILISLTICDLIIAVIMAYLNPAKLTLSLIIARMSAIVILLNMAYILIISSFNYSLIPDRIMSNNIPIKHSMYYHKCFGVKIFLGSIIHTIAHILHIRNILSFCKNGCEYSDVKVVPARSYQIVISYEYFSRQYAYITGGLLVLIFSFLAIYLGLSHMRYIRKYVGRLSHIVLSVAGLALVIAHGYYHLLGFNYSLVAVLPLLLVYIWRSRNYIAPLYIKINRSLVNKTFIRLYLEDDGRLANMLSSFDSVTLFVNHPSINSFEWHPFTLSRKYNSVDAILSLERSGPWTNALAKYLLANPFSVSRIRIGGYKRSIFRFHRLYAIRFFFCAGIGITAFISSMVDTVRAPFGATTTILVWSVNSVELINQFNKQIIEFQSLIKNIKIYIYFSNRKSMPDDDLILARFRYLQYTIFGRTGIDIVTRSTSPICCSFGRANFYGILSPCPAINRHSNIGVFVCGGEQYTNSVSESVEYINAKIKSCVYKLWTE